MRGEHFKIGLQPRAARCRLSPGAIFLALICAAFLSGCTPWGEYKSNGYKVGPNYCRPPAAVSDHWIDDGDKRLSSEEPDLSHWWTAFNDATLNDLIQAAYHQNLSLREACFRILEARAELAIQMGNLFPQTQQAVGNYTRNASSALAANQGLLQTGLFNSHRFFDNWNLGFNLSWELDFWGRFRRAIAAAADDLDASVFDYDDVLVTLLGDVANTYIELRTNQQEIEYVNDNIRIQKESLDIAQARFRGGLSSELDVEQATSQLAQTEALLPQFQKRIRQANDRLCVLLGIPAVDLTPKLGSQQIPSSSPDVVVGIPCDLLTRRPDVRSAERLAAAQCEQIGIAEADLYPSIAVTGTVGFDSVRFTDLFKNQSFQGTIGPGFQWNVLNYGRLVNNVRLQQAKFCELVTSYRNKVLHADSEVEDGIEDFLQSQLQAKAMQRSVDAAAKAVDLAITQYKAGLVDFNRVAVLEQNLVQQQDLLAQAQGDIALGLVETYRALGGGWEIACQGAEGEVTDQPATEESQPSGPDELSPSKSGPNSSAAPGTTAPGTATPPRQFSPRGLPLPGPAGGAPLNAPGAANPTGPQAGRRYSSAAQRVTVNRPSAAPSHTTEFDDKPMQLRYTNNMPAANRTEIAAHAELLPEDRGEVQILR